MLSRHALSTLSIDATRHYCNIIVVEDVNLTLPSV